MTILNYVRYRDVPDPDSTIRYPVKCRYPALSGTRVKFGGYLPDSTVTYFITNIKWKTCIEHVGPVILSS